MTDKVEEMGAKELESAYCCAEKGTKEELLARLRELEAVKKWLDDWHNYCEENRCHNRIRDAMQDARKDTT